jgi:molybdopterin synthase sulfur carrier subunit
MANVRIPVPLRKVTNNQEVVIVEGNDIGQIFLMLCARFPELHDRLFDENQQLRKFVKVFLNDEDIDFLQDFATDVKDTDTISIVPAIAGG